MEHYNIQKAKATKDKRVFGLVKALASLRISEKTDFVLECDDRTFPVHKLILEASSPYFETLFHSGLKEAKTGKMVVKNTKSEIMEIVLDFIYLGELSKLQNATQLQETLKVAHMLYLDDLFTYCCDMLLSMLSLKNVCDVWEVAVLYERNKLLEPLLDFMFANREELLASAELLNLSAELMRDFLQFSVTRQLCMNTQLGGLMKWLRADLPVRESRANELLQCIAVELVTQEFVSALMKDKDLMLSSEEIARSLRLFCSSVLMWVAEGGNFMPLTLDCGKASIIFFSHHSPSNVNTEAYATTDVSTNVSATHIQQFDVQNMTWLPVQLVDGDTSRAAYAKHGEYVYAVGGKLESVVVMYNTSNRTIEYAYWPSFKETSNAGMCFFDGNVYRFGGLDEPSQNISFQSFYGVTNDGNVKILNKISYPRVSPILLGTTDFIFVIGGNDPKQGVVIEFSEKPYCNARGEYCATWKTVIMPISRSFESQFFVDADTLQGISVGNETLIKLKFNKNTHTLETTQFSLRCPDGQSVTGVYQFPDSNSSKVFVSTVKDGPSIPNYLWEPEANKWIKLPSPKGNCSLSNTSNIKNKIYVVGV